jgi:hypothetical protein
LNSFEQKNLLLNNFKNMNYFLFFRTTSEGNAQFDSLAKSKTRAGGKSIISGSPMSPGSFVSSESAGSSNSLDEHEDRFGKLL